MSAARIMLLVLAGLVVIPASTCAYWAVTADPVWNLWFLAAVAAGVLLVATCIETPKRRTKNRHLLLP